MSEEKSHWQVYCETRTDQADNNFLIEGLGLVGILLLTGKVIFADDLGFDSNLYTEFISIVVTVFIIDALNRRRDERRRVQELKERLLREVRSPEPVISRHALHEIQDRFLHTKKKSVLKGGYLLQARWEGVTLNYFNLQEAFMTDSTLKNSRLFMVEMQRASLWLASMTNVSFIGVNLTESNLGNSNLVRVIMRNVNLHGANFESANMEGIEIRNSTLTSTNLNNSHLKNAILERNKYDENTILPDGEKWKQGTDLTRFTNPDHPDFCPSCDPNSLAYRGPEEVTD